MILSKDREGRWIMRGLVRIVIYSAVIAVTLIAAGCGCGADMEEFTLVLDLPSYVDIIAAAPQPPADAPPPGHGPCNPPPGVSLDKGCI